MIRCGSVRPGVCQGEGVHGSGVHGGIRRDSWEAFHLLVPSGKETWDFLYLDLLLKGPRWDFYGTFRAAVFGQVSEATVTIVERPWERVVVDGKPHSHGEQDYRLSTYACCRDWR